MLEQLVQRVRNGIVLGVLSLAPFVSGCYSHSIRDAPHPQFEQQVSTPDSEWNQYVTELYKRCGERSTTSLYGQEKLFYKYIQWMNIISGKDFDPEDFDIVSDNVLEAFFENGFVGLFMEEGVFWNGKIKILGKAMTPVALAHEMGHGSDAYFETFDWVTQTRARVRMEAVAEAFEHYVGLEVIRAGNISEGVGHRMFLPDVDKDARLMDILHLSGSHSRYNAAKCIDLVLMNNFRSMGKVWYYLAITDVDEVYKKVENVAVLNGGIGTAIEKGYELTQKELQEHLDPAAERLLLQINEQRKKEEKKEEKEQKMKNGQERREEGKPNKSKGKTNKALLSPRNHASCVEYALQEACAGLRE